MKAAVYTGTRNLYPMMVPAIKSLMKNSDVERIYLLIEDDQFPEWLPECVEVINVACQEYFPAGGPNMDSQYTYMAMMRAALCHILPELDRVLSLDVDTIVLEDVSDLWDLPIDGWYFAAAPEWHRTVGRSLYTNAGVVLYNLEQLRDGMADRVIGSLNRREWRWLEQDAFNAWCEGMIYPLPGTYNGCSCVKHPDPPKIRHYAAQKDWTMEPEYLKYEKMPWGKVRKGLHPPDGESPKKRTRKKEAGS